MVISHPRHPARRQHKALLAALAVVLCLHALAWLTLHRSQGLPRGASHTSVAAEQGIRGAGAASGSVWQVPVLALPWASGSAPAQSALVNEAKPTQKAHADSASHDAAALPPPGQTMSATPVLGGDTLAPTAMPGVDAATLGAMAPTVYISSDELDQSARPVEEWVLDEPVLMAVRKARLRLKVWVSEAGIVDGAELLSAEPAGDWSRQAIQSLPLTVMHPGMKDGRAVPSTVVVEIASEDLGYR